MEDFNIFGVNCSILMPFGMYMSCPFGIFLVIWCIFPRFGMLYL
jgi:hypothetical protein